MNNKKWIGATLETLLESLRSCKFEKFGAFVVGGLKNGRVQVNGYLQYNTINEIPKSEIKDELQKVKANFAIIMNESLIFKEYALSVGIDYYLLLDTGNAGISICAEIEGEYKEFI